MNQGSMERPRKVTHNPSSVEVSWKSNGNLVEIHGSQSMVSSMEVSWELNNGSHAV